MKELLIFIAVLAVGAVWSGGAQAQELGAGDMAPPFELPGSDGKTHRLADYVGKTVVLAGSTLLELSGKVR